MTCQNAHTFPVIRGIPRFVSTDAYTGSFSYEWNRFRKTQLDSFTGRTDTRDRLDTEFRFADYVSRAAPGSGPRPIAKSERDRIAAYEFVDGQPFRAGEVAGQLADGLRALIQSGRL